MPTIAAAKVDAFTSTPYTGNIAGVVPDAAGLTERQMQAIAREMNVSETSFVLPPSAPGAQMRLRYFTPTSEIKLCGHATVAMFHRLVEIGRAKPGDMVKLETGAGVLDVEIGAGPVVWMASDPVVFEPSPVSRAEAARLLGLGPESVVGDVELVKRLLFVPVAGLKAMESIRPDLRAIAQLYRDADVDGVVPVSLETHDPSCKTHIRDFVPGLGIDEDPVTGAAHMALGGWMAKRGHLQLPARFTGEQGHFCGRAGQVVVEVGGTREAPKVRIGGRAVTTLIGELVVP